MSILNDTKKMLDIGDDDTSFDLNIITHINSEFSTLTDIGVGPVEGFVIEDGDADWDEFVADDIVRLSKVKTCVFLRAKLLFDPPTSSFLMDSIQRQLQEAEWRLNVNREGTEWTDPNLPVPVESLNESGGST